MKVLLLTSLVLVFCLHSIQAVSADPFFANPELQRTHPAAFALQPEAHGFIQVLDSETKSERERLVLSLQQNPAVQQGLQHWESLPETSKIALLRLIFEIEVRTMNIAAPELIFDHTAAQAAYFDFDFNHFTPGKVILNPTQLFGSKNKLAAVLLLIHETRHSAQWQRSFRPSPADPLALGFRAAFAAQKAITTDFSFCDFLTLLNEFEAFQFANYVVGRLTFWSVDTLDMGTFASQYDNLGKLKIDLARLSAMVPPAELLTQFNELEKEQLRQLKERKD